MFDEIRQSPVQEMYRDEQWELSKSVYMQCWIEAWFNYNEKTQRFEVK